MPEGDAPLPWDFRTLLLVWNLCALPAVLLAAAALIAVQNRRIARTKGAGIDLALDGRRLVKILAILHLMISLQALLRLTQEVLTMREMGIPESFKNFVGQSIAVVVNPFLAVGFWRHWRPARWTANAWYALLSLIGLLVAGVNSQLPVKFDALWWADFVASTFLPLFLLFMMFLPRVKRVFARQKPDPVPEIAQIRDSIASASSSRWSIISNVALLCLILVCSNVLVETADWLERSISAPSDLLPEPAEIE